jgi:hypothetical protein
MANNNIKFLLNFDLFTFFKLEDRTAQQKQITLFTANEMITLISLQHVQGGGGVGGGGGIMASVLDRVDLTYTVSLNDGFSFSVNNKDTPQFLVAVVVVILSPLNRCLIPQ